MQTNTKGFAQLVETIADLMEHPSKTDSTGITLHRDLGWRLTFQPSDIDTEDEVAVLYKETLLEWTGAEDFDARAAAEWVADNIGEWLAWTDDEKPRFTHAEVMSHLA